MSDPAASAERDRRAYHLAFHAQVEVAAALANPRAGELAAAAARAEAVGHEALVPRLRELADPEAGGRQHRADGP